MINYKITPCHDRSRQGISRFKDRTSHSDTHTDNTICRRSAEVKLHLYAIGKSRHNETILQVPQVKFYS